MLANQTPSVNDAGLDPLLHAGSGDERWRVCVAPMMDWTDRHCRHFHRLLSPHARLYSEMVTSAALVHGDRGRLLERGEKENPVALQLGGSDPGELAWAAEQGQAAGYDEINLNVGCPSPRVQSGRFGACLMREPALVGQCVRAMQQAVDVPVTVKCRIGVDEQDAWSDLQHFVESMCAAGVQVLEVHARKAWLKGLSPKENRDVPPLDYARVYRVKQDFPQLTVVINGGIVGVDECLQHLRHVDGVMLGRAAYRNPWLLAELDAALWGTALPTRKTVMMAMCPYFEAELARGTLLKHMARHVLGLYLGQPGARGFRRFLGEGTHDDQAGIDLVIRAIEMMARLPNAA